MEILNALPWADQSLIRAIGWPDAALKCDTDAWGYRRSTMARIKSTRLGGGTSLLAPRVVELCFA
jgi:hypothetical protein